jgi:hypothetical protein
MVETLPFSLECVKGFDGTHPAIFIEFEYLCSKVGETEKNENVCLGCLLSKQRFACINIQATYSGGK